MGEVMASGGAKQVIFNAMFCTLNPEDEVIIPSPYWVSYPDITKLCDGRPVIVQCQQSDQFKIQPEQLRRAISDKTKWLILNSPNNPTGAVYSQEELRSLSKVLLDHPKVLVLCDDIYEHIVYDSDAFSTLAAVEPRLKDRTLIVNGVSKAYAMTGWRIGYSAGPKWLISAMTKLQGQSTTCPSSISQSAAAAALQGDQNIILEWREIYRARRDCSAGALKNIEGLNAMVPDGGFYLFVDCNELIHKEGASNAGIKNDIDLVEYLLRSTQVVLVPGSEFGLSNYFRLCFARTTDVLTLALEKISNACKRLN
jgi:aspartate aminotransferase